MGMDTSELARLEMATHELYILRYAELGKPIPADRDMLETLVEERLIEKTDRPDVNKLTELGRLACAVFRKQLPEVRG